MNLCEQCSNSLDKTKVVPPAVKKVMMLEDLYLHLCITCYEGLIVGIDNPERYSTDIS